MYRCHAGHVLSLRLPMVSVWNSSPRLAHQYDECGHVIVDGRDTRAEAALSG